jgi:hypothetical protein
MTDAQIKYMAERFLRWKLPENFNPDAGITNLFDYEQARAMVCHMIDGMPGEGTTSGG